MKRIATKDLSRFTPWALLTVLGLGLSTVATEGQLDPTEVQTLPPTQLQVRHLQRINQALGRWLALSRRDAPYLLIDPRAGEVRLQYHGALLRTCPLDSVRTPAVADIDVAVVDDLVVSAHLRRARPAGPYVQMDAGPFDWERYLADAATDDAALLLSDATLIYASAVWSPQGPHVRLSTRDLRALHDALDDGAAVIWLPSDWETGGWPTEDPP